MDEKSETEQRAALRALILENRLEDAELIARELRRSGFDPQWQRAETEPDFLANLTPPPDVILADYTLPELDARRALQLLEERGLKVPFIVVSGTFDAELAVSMIRQGAADYLLKDRLGRLGPAVKLALMEKKQRQQKMRAADELAAEEARFLAFLRHSPALAFINDATGRILYVDNASGHGEDIAAQLSAEASDFETNEPSRTVEQVTTAAGQIREMLCFRFLFNDATGRRVLGGVAVEITEQKAAERVLADALAAKEILVKEVHHRVKNNLQTVASLLNMQADLLPDRAARQALRDVQQRVHSMSLIHEQVYGSKNMDEVDFGSYAMRLARDLFESFGVDAGRVGLRFAFSPVTLCIDQTIPCGLILNELITNSLKYAFPGERAGEILVSLRCRDGKIIDLAVSDNGVGLPPDSEDRCSKSLGTRLVEILVKQLGGSFARQSAGGVTSIVTFTRSDKP